MRHVMLICCYINKITTADDGLLWSNTDKRNNKKRCNRKRQKKRKRRTHTHAQKKKKTKNGNNNKKKEDKLTGRSPSQHNGEEK